jgi:transposase
MEKRGRKSYSQEFRVQAIELAEQMGSNERAAEKLGIAADSIRYWRRKLGRSMTDQSKPVSQSMSEFEEIKRLKKQISELEKTNYILKKAAAFFSQDHLK